MTTKRKRITLGLDDGGMLELTHGRWNPSSKVWLRVETSPTRVSVESVNFYGKKLAALHAFAKKVVRATRPRRVTRKAP